MPKYWMRLVVLLLLLCGAGRAVSQVTYLASFDKKKIHFYLGNNDWTDES